MSQWWSDDDGETAADQPTVDPARPGGPAGAPPVTGGPPAPPILPSPPTAQLPPPPPGPGPHHVPAPSVVAQPAPPTVGAYAAPPPPRRSGGGRRWGLVVGGSLALVAVLAGAWVVYGFFTRGGASSPEAAVEALATAAESQDPALAASVLNPAETRLLANLADEVGSARGRVAAGSNGSAVGGTQIEVKDLRLRSEELGPRVARVTIRSADIEIEATRSAMPEAIRTGAFDMDDGSIRWNLDLDDTTGDVSVIVVEDGGWYVSPALTIADAFVSDRSAYEGEDVDADYEDFGEVETFDEGAETPEDAIDLLADAISSGDPRDMVAALPSDQGQFGVVYGDALESILTTSIDTSVMSEGWLTVDDVEVDEEEGPDGTTRLLIRSATVADNSSGDVWQLDGVDICAGGAPCDNAWSTEGTALRGLVEESLDGSLSLIARPVDGGWKIDPVASILDMATRLVGAADAGVVRSALRSTSGEPTASAQVGATADIALSSHGFALVEVPTTPCTSAPTTGPRWRSTSVPTAAGSTWTRSGPMRASSVASEPTRTALEWRWEGSITRPRPPR